MTTLTTTPSNASNQPTHEFRAAKKQIWLYASIGLLGLAGIVFAMAVNAEAHPPTTPLIIGLLMAVWVARARPVRIYDDRVEIKAAPLAPLRVIDFSDIEELDESKPKRVLVRRTQDAEGKGIRLPLHLLEQGDRARLLDALSVRI